MNSHMRGFMVNVAGLTRTGEKEVVTESEVVRRLVVSFIWLGRVRFASNLRNFELLPAILLLLLWHILGIIGAGGVGTDGLPR